MRDEDQRLRQQAPSLPPAIRGVHRTAIRKVQRANTTRMRRVVDAYGWPGRRLVGDEASSAAWLLVQHADHDLSFQRRCLELMRQAVARQDASPSDLAYLSDRVAIRDGRPQTYGTQLMESGGHLVPFPIDDADRVDCRRAQVGLPPLDQYLAMVARHWSPAAPTVTERGPPGPEAP